VSAGPTDAGADPGRAAGTADERVELLAAVAAALSSAGSLPQVMRALVGSLAPALCDGCEVAMPDDDGVLRRVAAGPGSFSTREHAPIPDLADHPLRRAMDGELQVLHLDDPDQVSKFGPPEIPTSARALGTRSAVVAPMTGRSTVLGALAAAQGPSGRDWSPADVEFVASVARLGGLAIENLQSLEHQERTVRRLLRAGRVAAALNDADDIAEIARVVSELAGAELGSTTGLTYLFDGHALQLASSRGYEAAQLEGWHTIELDRSAPTTDACRAGAIVACESPDEVLARYPHLAATETYGDHAFLAAPLQAGDDLIGAAYWAFDEPRTFTDDDLGFVELVAEQTVAAVTRAQARSAQEQVSRRLEVMLREQQLIDGILQTSLLPASLPAIPGFELTAHYWPDGEGMQVGGDFYDVFEIGPGRWALLIGDVCGKGAEAAVVTATARHTARAAALHLSDPEAILAWVHDAVAALASATFCTVALCLLDTDPGAAPRLSVTLAGHPPGILVRAGAATELGTYGSLLGVMDPELHPVDHVLRAGDLVVLYTDGITDAPGGQAMPTTELRTWLEARATDDLERLGAELRAELLHRRPEGLHDDVAVVMLRADA
jgi:sigma-B regulation protein RsbU (phosphoserine phosphatase)